MARHPPRSPGRRGDHRAPRRHRERAAGKTRRRCMAAATQAGTRSTGKGGGPGGAGRGPTHPPRRPPGRANESTEHPRGRAAKPPQGYPRKTTKNGATCRGRRAERGAGRSTQEQAATAPGRPPPGRGPPLAGRSKEGLGGLLPGVWGASRRRSPARRTRGLRVPIKSRAGVLPGCWPSLFRSARMSRRSRPESRVSDRDHSRVPRGGALTGNPTFWAGALIL